MRAVALDLSLTCTGVADTRGLVGSLKPKPPGIRGVKRLRWIREAVRPIVEIADLAVIEDYSFGSRGRAVFNIGELGGVIRVMLDDMGVPWTALTPSTVKKLATGKGNASKEEVLVEAVKRLGYGGSSTDEADALWLLQAARQHYELDGAVDLPKKNLSALEVVEWPTENRG